MHVFMYFPHLVPSFTPHYIIKVKGLLTFVPQESAELALPEPPAVAGEEEDRGGADEQQLRE